MDDPKQGSSKYVELPASCNAAYLGIEALLPTILERISVIDVYTGYRLQLLGNLSATGVLDVIVSVQLEIVAGWKCVSVPSLTAFLVANQDIATQILAAWDALDVVISAANQVEEWL
jgi:hypothetical protein